MDDYASNLANDIVQNGDQNGDLYGQNFNNGVVAPVSNGGQGPVTGGASASMPEGTGTTASPNSTSSPTNQEDPLFTVMAGNSQQFVGGIPKEQWDAMSPEARQNLLQISGPAQTLIRATGSAVVGAPMAVGGAILGTAAGAGIGGAIANAPGAVAGGVMGGIAGGGAGGNFGGQIGSELADHYIQEYNRNATPPPTMSRQQLYDQFNAVKNSGWD